MCFWRRSPPKFEKTRIFEVEKSRCLCLGNDNPTNYLLMRWDPGGRWDATAYQQICQGQNSLHNSMIYDDSQG